MNRGKGAKDKAQETHIDTGTHMSYNSHKTGNHNIERKKHHKTKNIQKCLEFILCLLVHRQALRGWA